MTSIRLELTPELEQQLQTAASSQGLQPDGYILKTLAEHFQQTQQRAHLPTTEANLLQHIGIGLSAPEWERYRLLIAKRRAATLTSDEQTELIQTSDRIELANAKRMEAAIALAKLRGQSLAEVMQDLGIEAPPYV